MRILIAVLLTSAIQLAGAAAPSSQSAPAAQGAKVESRFAEVNGLRMHYLAAGTSGSPVILLHGYAQNSHMWRPLTQA